MAARRTKARAKINIPMCLACVLLCLTLVSARLSSSVVARYSSTTNSGDGARVISFGDLTLTEVGGDSQYIAPGVVLEWNALVSFVGSESATYVFLEVSGVASGGAGAVALFSGGPSWSVDTEWDYLGAYSGTHVYYRELEPNVPLVNAALFVSNSAVVSESLTAQEIAAMGSVFPQFRASVVQSNGFDSPAAAWQSLEVNHP